MAAFLTGELAPLEARDVRGEGQTREERQGGRRNKMSAGSEERDVVEG